MSGISDTCRECGGPVEAVDEGAFRDWICQDCGVVAGGGMLLKDAEGGSR